MLDKKPRVDKQQHVDRTVAKLCRDYVDLAGYRIHVSFLQPILNELLSIRNNSERCNNLHVIDVIYEEVFDALKQCASFAAYIDDVIARVVQQYIGCTFHGVNADSLLYSVSTCMYYIVMPTKIPGYCIYSPPSTLPKRSIM